MPRAIPSPQSLLPLLRHKVFLSEPEGGDVSVNVCERGWECMCVRVYMGV